MTTFGDLVHLLQGLLDVYNCGGVDMIYSMDCFYHMPALLLQFLHMSGLQYQCT